MAKFSISLANPQADMVEFTARLMLAAMAAGLCLIPLGFVIVAVLGALGHTQDWWTPAFSGAWAILTLGFFIHIHPERAKNGNNPQA